MVKSFRLLPLPARRKPSSSHGPILLHGARHEAHWQPAVGDLGRQLDHRLAAGGEIDRDVGVHVQDRLQRLGESGGAFALVGQADLAAFVRHGFFALEDLAHDRDVVLDPVIGLAPRLAVPALDDLRSRDTQACDETAATGHRINAGGRHGGVGRRSRGQLHDAGAELDAVGLGGEERERRDRVGAIGFGRPDRVVTQFFRPLHKGDRHFQMCARIAD